MNLEREPQEGSLERSSPPRQRDGRVVLDVQVRGQGAPGSTRAGAKPQVRSPRLERRAFQHHGSPDGDGDGWEGKGMGELGRVHSKDFFKTEGGG